MDNTRTNIYGVQIMVTKQCNEHALKHIAVDVYREHEIVVMQCPKCHKFVVDVRVDNFDGEFMAGFIDYSLTYCMIESVREVDEYELNKIELPY